jgi:hypothetical protein
VILKPWDVLILKSLPRSLRAMVTVKVPVRA